MAAERLAAVLTARAMASPAFQARRADWWSQAGPVALDQAAVTNTSVARSAGR